MSNKQDEQKPGEISVNPLTYYQKPAIGQDHHEDLSPVQILFPTGGFGLGIAFKNPEHEHHGRERNTYGVITSAPTNSELDQTEKRGLVLTFMIIGVVNIILTTLMYVYADSADYSKVEPGTGFLPFTFEQVPSTRRNIERINFGFTIFILGLGMISVLIENTLGLSGYCLAIILNFFLATSSLPYLVFSFRYILDVGMLYIGLVIRSRFMYTFLPLHINRR
jgi:hypothetical protein